MNEKEFKIKFEETIINILKNNNIYDDNLKIDIFRGDETLSYDRYIDLYNLKEIKNNIKSFNNNFESLGGRIYNKQDNVADFLNLKDTYFNYNSNYIYTIPSYTKDYDYINDIVNAKLKKLKDNKDYLVIASPIRANLLDNKKELEYLKNICNKYNLVYSKIMIINLNKISIYDTLNNIYDKIVI